MKYKIPPLHNIEAYKKAVMSIPNLKEGEDFTVEDLILSHLKLVVSIAGKYAKSENYEDLIQVGNYALIKAAQNYDADSGNAFASYAKSNIIYAMMQGNIDMKHQIKLVTTKPLKKAYNHIMKYREGGKTMTAEQITNMANDLGIKPSEITDMETRLYGTSYVMLDQNYDDASDSGILEIEDITLEPTEILQMLEFDDYLSNDVVNSINVLNDREKDIIRRRFLTDNSPTLAELGIEYGVSTERIRQIEANALKKMRKVLQPY